MLSRHRDYPTSRFFHAVIGIVLIGSIILPTSQRAAAQPRSAAAFIDNGTVTFVSPGLATDIDPANNESEYGATVERNVDEALVRLAGSSLSSYEPGLATSWNANADKSIWTFHLRHGVRFHTGRCCMTADDVKYSLARAIEAQLAGSYMMSRFITDPEKQIKIVDPYTVEFDLGHSQPVFLSAAGQDYNSMILDSQAVKAHVKGKDFGHAWAALNDAGTGPYMIQSWQQSQQVVMTRFPGYWGGWSGPHFSKIIFSQVNDPTTRREMMERGQADITFDLTPQDYDQLKTNGKVAVIAPYATETFYIVMTQAGLLKSPASRQALSYAFNYDALIKGVLHGYAKRLYGPIPSTVVGYDPNTFKYQYDLKRAAALFQQAGIKTGTTLTYTYESVFPSQQIGLILQAGLQQIGINLKLEEVSTAAFNNIFYSTPSSPRPNLMPYQWWPDYNDPYDFVDTLLDSKQAAPNGNNGGLYHNAQVDALLGKMKYADSENIVRDAKQLQDITGRQDPPAIWTHEPAQTTVLASTLKGYVFNPIELRTFYFYTMHH